MWIYEDLERISMIQGLARLVAPGVLWRPVAASREPLFTPSRGLGWQACWMARCLDGALVGWLDGAGGHHSCNLERSTPRRVGRYLYLVVSLPRSPKLLMRYHNKIKACQ